MTTVFSACVTAHGQARADVDVYMPGRWSDDLLRRRAAGIPDDLEFVTKPQLATNQLGRLTAAGPPARWVAFDEVCGPQRGAPQDGREGRAVLAGVSGDLAVG